ncbi:LysR family transcriptional regulator (chromosome initiation inhibitor) [Mumia flava]|uniref:LysR family transcriptional regulator (Chromosome initiation inhibitor) n=1 Tax=Mumia flava TaxID=1348852 RepID=A0A0B2BGP1_9ACTN|nr:LysR family transcriptional regulator ArgP [Mumia flava]PJJ56435.1 LysR family transcriptional regulator (chromosome initiation inhibitor) [Mumia flava]
MSLDLAQLRALAAVVTEGSFDAAARSLHVTPSAVSQRIKALESAAGRTLVRRTRPVAATEAGTRMLRLARDVDLLVSEAQASLSTDPDAGPVRVPIAVNADSLATWVLPALAEAADGVVVDLHRADQDRTAGLLRDGVVMAAVTSDRAPVQGCSVTRLGTMRYRPCAAPGFVARHLDGRPFGRALRSAPVVVFDRTDRLQDDYLTRHAVRPGDPPRHHVPGSDEFLAAVRLGLGWGMLPDLQTEALRAAGDVVVLEPGASDDVELVWQRWRLPSEALDRVTASVVRHGRAALA